MRDVYHRLADGWAYRCLQNHFRSCAVEKKAEVGQLLCNRKVFYRRGVLHRLNSNTAGITVCLI